MSVVYNTLNDSEVCQSKPHAAVAHSVLLFGQCAFQPRQHQFDASVGVRRQSVGFVMLLELDTDWPNKKLYLHFKFSGAEN